jgi:hypothetical protein
MTTLNREDMTHQFSLNCFAQRAPLFKAKETLRTINHDIEHALAGYHIEQDMEAMAARIDQLLEENAKLTSLLEHHKNWLRIANDQWSKADENLTNYMVKVALTP